MTIHEQLLKRLKSTREGKTRREKFGHGLTTADSYVRRAFDDCGAGLTCRTFANGDKVENVLKAAASKLAYSGPDLVMEKAASHGQFADLLPAGVEAPKGTLMVVRHVVTSDREDRDKDVLETKGAELDPHAPLLWQHMHSLPLGKVVTTIERTPKVLRAATALLDLNELTEDAAKLIEADSLRFAHGFRALEFEERKAEEESGMFPGFRITKFEIMEVSLVSVPSNVDAEIELYSRGKLASDFFKSHAKHYFDDRQVQVSGADLSGTTVKLKIGDAEVELTSGTKAAPEPVVEPIETAPVEPAAEKAPAEKCGCGVASPDAEPEADKSQDQGPVKMSGSEMQTIKEVAGDLEAMRGMNLPGDADKMCEKCSGKLKKMIDQAEPVEDDGKSIDPSKAAQILLGCDDLALLRRAKSAIEAVLLTASLDEKANRYRELVSG